MDRAYNIFKRIFPYKFKQHAAYIRFYSKLDSGMDGKGLLETVLGAFELEILEQTPVEYRCYCSRERVTRTLISLGRKELQDIVDEGKPIDIDCQFCDQIYRYTPEEIAEILKEL